MRSTTWSGTRARTTYVRRQAYFISVRLMMIGGFVDVVPVPPDGGIAVGILEGLRYVNPSFCVLERRRLKPAPDDATPIGPCLVSAGAIADPQRLGLKCTVNGKVMQDGSTA